ncbi:hypothetical protein IO424_001758 [Campylobacter fetus]|uniref:hypothetical protein n=1 Tax=Campylobacter fetus TaxID=196 RepID=UPI0012732168|nr:hypothetical protein [Campylobacter fetus]WKW17962.1 hypothetical protein IXZ25_03540 [Campylobacter fetus subsp. fetus]EAJ5693197.1 hypothetical protein [Campylobacter fetus]EAJ5705193.1 hypothetical protein [Campylobacter fetus]EAJ9257409.1 hypothetical protein [Campylobacter fetus]EAK0814765.1 hypothetical protein [Campylobacter fetus]
MQIDKKLYQYKLFYLRGNDIVPNGRILKQEKNKNYDISLIDAKVSLEIINSTIIKKDKSLKNDIR